MGTFYNASHKFLEQPILTAFSAAPHITPRETQILVLMEQGMANKKIAQNLSISVETVNTHLKNIYQKTGARNKIEALIRVRGVLSSLPATETTC